MTTGLAVSMATAGVAAEGQVNKPEGSPWTRHTIDGGSRGADGTRVADINDDGLPDLTTGWEEGGEVRVYLNPGTERSDEAWPLVVVGEVASPEDAVFVDVNGDGRLDVVSSCEGQERTVYAHFSPVAEADVLKRTCWTTAAFATTQGAAMWMFALPLQVDGRHGTDLVLGSKGDGAQVGWLEAPAHPGEPGHWTWHPLVDAGWIMSLRNRDMDHDGDQDVVLSDRRGAEPGIWWLENPGVEAGVEKPWRKHPIAGQGREVMFLDIGDLDGDGLEDIVCAVRQEGLLVSKRRRAPLPLWQEEVIPMPGGVGNGKGVALGDLDGNGTTDIVVSCESAKGVSGVFWLRRSGAGGWLARDISGAQEGVKFDRIELLDLDGDADLDVVTCEEVDNLGVIWYENPARSTPPRTR